MTALRLCSSLAIASGALLLCACQLAPVDEDARPHFTATAYVTGSRIAHPVDPRTGEVQTAHNVRVLNLRSGRDAPIGNVSDLLRALPFIY